MTRNVGPPEATCHVFTFREGLLAGFGHDLDLTVTRFRIEIDDSARRVAATFDATSLRVAAALRDGVELPGGLRDSDRATIEADCRTDVLRAAEFPEIRFRSTAALPVEGGWDMDGVLTLVGVDRPLRLLLRRQGRRFHLEVSLHTPTWGIRPYSAMLGALKVQPDVTVRLSLPAAPG